MYLIENSEGFLLPNFTKKALTLLSISKTVNFVAICIIAVLYTTTPNNFITMCFHGPVSLIKKVLPFSSQGSSLLILGLDNAGKSTLTTRLAGILNGASKESTKEASEWTFKVNRSKLQLWDINGELKNRQLWPNYYQKAKVLIFVIDSKDGVRLGEARCVLCDVLLHEELQKAPLLIVSNKKDTSGSLPSSAVIDMMGLDRLEGREWAIKECSVETGDGIQDIANWITAKIKN